MKIMDTGVALGFLPAAVNAAAGDDGHIRILSDDKRVVNHIMKTRLG